MRRIILYILIHFESFYVFNGKCDNIVICTLIRFDDCDFNRLFGYSAGWTTNWSLWPTIWLTCSATIRPCQRLRRCRQPALPRRRAPRPRRLRLRVRRRPAVRRRHSNFFSRRHLNSARRPSGPRTCTVSCTVTTTTASVADAAAAAAVTPRTRSPPAQPSRRSRDRSTSRVWSGPIRRRPDNSRDRWRPPPITRTTTTTSRTTTTTFCDGSRPSCRPRTGRRWWCRTSSITRPRPPRRWRFKTNISTITSCSTTASCNSCTTNNSNSNTYGTPRRLIFRCTTNNALYTYYLRYYTMILL